MNHVNALLKYMQNDLEVNWIIKPNLHMLRQSFWYNYTMREQSKNDLYV